MTTPTKFKLPESWLEALPVTWCRECREKKPVRYVDPCDGGLCLDCRPWDDDPRFTIGSWTPAQLLEFLEANDVVRMKIDDVIFGPRKDELN